MFFLLILSRADRVTRCTEARPQGPLRKVAAGEIKSFTGMSADALLRGASAS